MTNAQSVHVPCFRTILGNEAPQVTAQLLKKMLWNGKDPTSDTMAMFVDAVG